MKTAQQRDAVNAHRRELRAVNRDAKLAKRRAEYSTNRDKINEQKRAWYQANIERERAHHRVRERQRWQENPEKLRVQARIRNAHNPEPNRKRVKAWQLAHPERFREQLRVHKQKRRARKKGNGGSWTAKEWATLKRQYGYYCVGCWKTERELQALGRTLMVLAGASLEEVADAMGNSPDVVFRHYFKQKGSKLAASGIAKLGAALNALTSNQASVSPRILEAACIGAGEGQ